MYDFLRSSDFEKDLKSGKHVGYLLFGEEDYLKNHAISQARSFICQDETFAPFNEMIMDNLSFSSEALMNSLMPMPMMADRKLIIVKGFCPDDMSASAIDDLCQVLGQLDEYDYNVVLMIAQADKLDPGYLPKRPSALLTKLCEYLVPVQFEKSTPSKLVNWAVKHFLHWGVQATPQLCQSMIDYCGTSMYVLASEIEKVSYYVLAHGRTTPSLEDVYLVANPTIEFDSFALSNALLERRPDVALNVLNDQKLRRVDPIMIMGEINKCFCDMAMIYAMTQEGHTIAEMAKVTKLHEYKVGLYMKAVKSISHKRMSYILKQCAVADTQLKLSPQGYAALEKLLCAI